MSRTWFSGGQAEIGEWPGLLPPWVSVLMPLHGGDLVTVCGKALLNSLVSIFLPVKQGFIIIFYMVVVRANSIISVGALSKPQNALPVMSLFLS